MTPSDYTMLPLLSRTISLDTEGESLYVTEVRLDPQSGLKLALRYKQRRDTNTKEIHR